MYAFKVPDIGEGVVEAEVLAWRVAEGDVVREDQVLVELLTDKAEIEIPSPRAGRVHRLHFEVGETARVGDVLIEIEEQGSASESAPTASAASKANQASEPGEPKTSSAAPPSASRSSASSESASSASQEAAPRARAESRAGVDPKSPPAMPERPRARASATPDHPAPSGPVEAVPAVRELATRLGVELSLVRGTGPRGRIMRRDVEAYAAGGSVGSDSGPAAGGPAVRAATSQQDPVKDPADWTRQPLRGLRRTIAERMSLSRRTAAHFTYVDEVDMSALLERIEAVKLRAVSPLAFIAGAAVRALASFPILNASIDDARGEIVMKGQVHLGIAAATEQGLVVPVIRDAAKLGALELSEQIRALGEGARSGSLGPTQLRGSTFTITSLGKLGGVISTPILNPPEVAILGVNAIRKLPRVIDERVVARSVMNLSLSVDHRIADGAVAARFIAEMKRILEDSDFEELRAKDPHE